MFLLPLSEIKRKLPGKYLSHVLLLEERKNIAILKEYWVQIFSQVCKYFYPDKRVTELLRLGNNLVQLPHSEQLSHSRLLCCNQFYLNISTDGNSRMTLQPVPVFDYTQGKKHIVSCFSGVSHISICVHCLFFCLWILPRRVQLCFLYSPSQVFIHMNKISLSLLISKLDSPSSFSLSTYGRWSSPFIIFVALCCAHFSYVHVFPILESPGVHAASRMPHQD